MRLELPTLSELRRRRTQRESLRRSRCLAAKVVLGREGGIEPDAAGEPTFDLELRLMRDLASTLEQLPPGAWPTYEAMDRTASKRTPRRRVRPWRVGTPTVGRTWIGALSAAVMAAVFLAGSVIHPTFSGASHVHSRVTASVTLQPLPGQPADALATAQIVRGARIAVTVEHLPPSRAGTFYELWLMTSTTRLVPVASFRVPASGQQSMLLVLPADPHAYRYLDISIQRSGASAAISSNSILRGLIS